jgi:hypothetical protein
MPKARPKRPGSSVLVKRLLWLYFFLLIFEGAFRKWIVPGLSTPLLLVRDPVVLLIYLVALENNLFPEDGFLSGCFTLASLSALLLCVQMISLDLPLKVLVYGLRTDFLHLPLIFLIPEVFRREDLNLIGKWILWISIPMALLMADQFHSDPGAWINRTAGTGEGLQLGTAMGKIRPPGTFSFITGAVSFFALVTAILGYAISNAGKFFPRWLVIASALSTGLALVVSGSRSMILSAGLVAAGWLVGITASRQIAAGFSRIILLLFCVAFLAVQIGEVETFHEGMEVLTSRFEAGGGSESVAGGLVGRFLDSFLAPLRTIETVPLLGYGLGVGTNVGAAIIQGEAGFLLSEGEWGRIILEMGPILGMAFILYRVCLMFSLGKNALRCTQRGYVLPVLLWSSCATTIFNGQIGQPTNLGFMVLIAGLTLCAIGIARSEGSAPDAKELRKPRRLGFR